MEIVAKLNAVQHNGNRSISERATSGCVVSNIASVGTRDRMSSICANTLIGRGYRLKLRFTLNLTDDGWEMILRQTTAGQLQRMQEISYINWLYSHVRLQCALLGVQSGTRSYSVPVGWWMPRSHRSRQSFDSFIQVRDEDRKNLLKGVGSCVHANPLRMCIGWTLRHFNWNLFVPTNGQFPGSIRDLRIRLCPSDLWMEPKKNEQINHIWSELWSRSERGNEEKLVQSIWAGGGSGGRYD